MPAIGTVARSGHGLALLTSRLHNDYGAFQTLVKTVEPVPLLDACVAFAGYLASRAAALLSVASTGEPVTADIDGGLWQVIDIARTLDDPTPDNPVIGALSSVYRARDAFLNSLAASLGDSVPSADGRSDAVVVFWDGWDEDDYPEVAYGIGSALTRLFFLAALADLEDADDTSDGVAEILAAFRRDIASEA
jgi:hypothetical protein